MLDAAEYFHLALHAGRKGDDHAALGYLKEALAQEPDNAAIRYMLAAEHAEIGLYERAIEGMQEALRLAPGLDTARFQLGLLFLQLGRPEDAREPFTVLAQRSDDMALKDFAQAYVALIDNDPVVARPLLERGVACCNNNQALKGDMLRVLASLDKPDRGTEAPATGSSSAIFLGAYLQTDESA